MFSSLTIPRLVLLATLASLVFAVPLDRLYFYFAAGLELIGTPSWNVSLSLFFGLIVFHPLFFSFFGTLRFLSQSPRNYKGFLAFVSIPALILNSFWLLGWQWREYFFFLAIALVLAALGTLLGLSLRYVYLKLKR